MEIRIEMGLIEKTIFRLWVRALNARRSRVGSGYSGGHEINGAELARKSVSEILGATPGQTQW